MIAAGYAVVAVVIGYLLGSIPAGYVMGRLYGVDVRKVGSGKTGGTNLARVVGWPKTIPVAIGDPAKAVLAIVLARWITGSEVVAVLAALAAMAGHLWPIYIGFRGGRGVGPVVGALLVFSPLIGAVSVVRRLSHRRDLSLCVARLDLWLSPGHYSECRRFCHG